MKRALHILIVILFLGFYQNLEGQQGLVKGTDSSFDDLIELVLENNKTLQAARDQVDASVLEAGTGNAPSDPQVEMGFMAGKPTGTGSKLDFSVSQEFDFPSAYVHKSRLKQERSRHAELSYDLTKQEILLEAKKRWIMAVFLNVQETFLAHRLENAKTLQDHFKQKLDAGEVSALSYSQSNLQLISLQTEYEELQLAKAQNQLGIDLLSGVTEYNISTNEFPAPRILLSDSLLKSYKQSPELQYYLREKGIKEREKSLAVSQNLPKLSAGYYSETVIDHQYKGLRVGFTVPLWENTNKIKAAKAKVVFAGADADRFAGIQTNEVRQKLERSSSLDLRIASLERALSEVKDEELLKIAQESGEISLAEYIYSSELYFQNLLQLQELKRDRLLVEADLLKVYF
ncbi:MAG: TolC family protein [Bacteroidales bacterium]|jgi:cobalt-zinc-cadmium efflux system outer membrane protein|nr:TolC family protein [Bacteroidales bacterium]